MNEWLAARKGERERLVLTVPEAGKFLGIGRAAAYNAVRVGQIPSLRIGRRLLVSRVALEQMLGITAHITAQESESVAP